MHSLRLKSLFWTLAALGLAACGARSTLYEPPASAETGGGGAGGTGGTGGAGGTGGGPTTTTTTSITTTTTTTSITGMVDCGVLSYAEPFASLQGGTMEDQRSPRLTYSSPDGKSVTLATAWSAAGQMNTPIELRHTTFLPWDTFPVGAGLGPTYLADLDAGGSFAVAPSYGAHFAMLYRNFQANPPNGLLFSTDFAPGSGDIPTPIVADSDARTASFLARGDNIYGFGAIARLNGGRREIRGGLLKKDALVSMTPFGCAQGATVADGVAYKDSFFMAFGNGAALGDVGCNGMDPGPPTLLHFVLFTENQASFAEIDSGPEITDVAMAPRSDGAWLVWSHGPDTLRVLRLDPQGQPIGVNIELNVPYAPGSVAAASANDFLMLGWRENSPEGTPTVQVFAPDASIAGGLQVKPTGEARGRLALLGAPASRSWVLAWSETASEGDQLRVTRLDCLGN